MGDDPALAHLSVRARSVSCPPQKSCLVTLTRSLESQHLVLFFLGTYNPDQGRGMSEAAASTFLTVSTNIIVTTFITFHLLRARRSLEKLMPSADMRTYTGVIAILIESAAPLTVFGIISAIMQQLTTSLSDRPDYIVSRFIFDGLFYSFCVSSVYKERSLWSTTC